MTVVLIPRTRNLDPIIEWLEANIAPCSSPRQPYVRQYGPGWDVRTFSEPLATSVDQIHWKFTIDDDAQAVIFSLRWS